MNNACPQCGAIYAVAEKDIGRRIACKKCSAALVVAAAGLELASPAKQDESAEKDPNWNLDEERGGKRDDDNRGSKRRRPRDDDDDDGAPSAAAKAAGPGMDEILKKFKNIADVATLLYGFGLFFTVYGFFASQMDDANVKSAEGAIAYDSVNQKAIARAKGDKASTVEEAKKIFERQNELVDDLAYARADQGKAAKWNVRFLMFGFFLLAFGSIGFLKPEESPLKRILGGGTILVILLQVTGVAGGLRTHSELSAPLINFTPPK